MLRDESYTTQTTIPVSLQLKVDHIMNQSGMIWLWFLQILSKVEEAQYNPHSPTRGVHKYQAVLQNVKPKIHTLHADALSESNDLPTLVVASDQSPGRQGEKEIRSVGLCVFTLSLDTESSRFSTGDSPSPGVWNSRPVGKMVTKGIRVGLHAVHCVFLAEILAAISIRQFFLVYEKDRIYGDGRSPARPEVSTL